MKRKDATSRKEMRLSVPRSQVMLFGLLGGAAAFFGTVENGQFNTWINFVIRFDFAGWWAPWMVGLMTNLSALMGLIFMIVWGAYSDTLPAARAKRWGRRKPFILFGGIVAGIAMLLYTIGVNFWICLFLDVAVIGIAMNAFHAGNKALIPDLTPKQERGRVNGLVNLISGFFGFLAIGLFLVVEEVFTTPHRFFKPGQTWTTLPSSTGLTRGPCWPRDRAETGALPVGM